jgi:hypothetical protein
MRIEGRWAISSGNISEISDLVRSLDKGDVIRAKVLDTSPGEIVLRLSDGTVLKAAAVSDTGLKAGDTATLRVKTRTESQILLEILGELSPHVKSGIDKLRKLLGELDIEPGDENLELASELLKYKAELNADDMAKALELLRNSDVFDPKNAAFITAKKIDPDKFDHQLLARLLRGDMKLGRLLDSLARALSLIADREFPSGTFAEITETINENPALSTPSGQASHETHAALQNVQTAANAADDIGSALPMNSAENTGEPSRAASSDITIVLSTAGNDVTESRPTVVPGPDGSHTDPVNVHAQLSETESTSVSASESGSAAGPESRPSSGTESGSAAGAAKEPAHAVPASADRIISGDTASAALPVRLKKEAGFVARGDDPGSKGKAPVTAARLKASIDDLSVRISKDLSAEDINAERLKNGISKLVADVEALFRSPQLSSSDTAENAARSAALLGETVRMLDLLNSFSILYYQLPLNLGGGTGTAELYVMKRKQNRKKIDPNDTVIFLSLDTLNMGRVEALLDIKGNGISIDFRTERQAVGDFIKHNITGLYTGISESGYKIVNIRYSDISAPASPIEQEKLLLGRTGISHGKIDYRI